MLFVVLLSDIFSLVKNQTLSCVSLCLAEVVVESRFLSLVFFQRNRTLRKRMLFRRAWKIFTYFVVEFLQLFSCFSKLFF